LIFSGERNATPPLPSSMTPRLPGFSYSPRKGRMKENPRFSLSARTTQLAPPFFFFTKNGSRAPEPFYYAYGRSQDTPFLSVPFPHPEEESFSPPFLPSLVSGRRTRRPPFVSERGKASSFPPPVAKKEGVFFLFFSLSPPNPPASKRRAEVFLFFAAAFKLIPFQQKRTGRFSPLFPLSPRNKARIHLSCKRKFPPGKRPPFPSPSFETFFFLSPGKDSPPSRGTAALFLSTSAPIRGGFPWLPSFP